MIQRRLEARLVAKLQRSAAVVLLGPRQIGKTTLARRIAGVWPRGAIYLDLERPADRRRLTDADAFLRAQSPSLVVLDEIHRLPELFEILRGVIDDNRQSGNPFGQFLLLGSASLDLIKHSSESLAGRIAHLELTGIDPVEAIAPAISLEKLWLRGGYPDSLTAATDSDSLDWREDIIQTYLEREIPIFAPRIPATTLRRLWTMLAYTSGELLNISRLAANLSLSGPTVDRYIDLLTDLGLIRRLQPWFTNIGKRLIKSPKLFVRDSGLLHALLEVENLNQLHGHPSVGASFESLAVESLVNAATDPRPFFYRTARGDEIDLLLTDGGGPQTAIEIKLSTAPVASAGFYRACDDLGITDRYIVHPGDIPAYRHHGATVIGLTELTRRLSTA
jgi:predicted AAA+ superfamily ATPase